MNNMKQENSAYLVDGKYGITDLLDLEELRGLFEKFTRATGFTIGFLDHPGMNILVATGWRDICTKFHRSCPASAEICTKSNRHLLDALNEPGKVVIEACENGMIDCAIPIIIKGKHIASLATGQLLLEPPDIERFKRQAKMYGYNEQAYLAALKKIPIVSRETLQNVIAFLGEIAHTISEMGYTNLVIKEELKKLEKEIGERKRAEEALRESEAQYRLLVENTTDIIWTVDMKMRPIYMNSSVTHLLGYSVEEAMSRTMQEAFSPASYEVAKQVLEEELAREQAGQANLLRSRIVELELGRKDGSFASVEANFSFLHDANGQPCGIQAIARDITDRKRVEEVLRESEEKYRSLTDNVNVGVYRNTVGPKGKFIEANPALVSMFGFQSREEFFARSVADLYQDPEGRKAFNEKITKEGFVRGEELLLKKKDGTSFLGSVSAVAVKNEEGRIKYYDGIIEDITERKQAEEALKESEQRFRTFFEGAIDGILLADIETKKFHTANTMICTMLGYSLEEIKNLGVIDIHPQEALPFVMEQFDKLAREEITKTSDLPVKRKDGSIFYAEISSVILKLDTGTYLMGTFRDITDRRRVKEALKESETRFRTLFEAIPDTVLVHDDEGTILHINEIGAQKLEWSAKDLEGRNLREIVTPDNAVSIANHVGETHKAGWSIFETTYVARSGWQIMAEVHERPIKFGGVKAILSVARDITDRKRTEEALQASEQHYRTLFEESLDGICVADAETGSIIDCNQAMAALVCRERAGLIGKPQKILHPPQDDKAAFSPTFKQHRTDKEGQILETQVVTRTGDIREVEIKANLLDLKGRKLLQGVFHDITERKRTETELQESEERFRLAFENANIGVCLIDLEGNLTRVNTKMCEVFGYTKKDLERLTVNDIAHPEDIDTSPTFMKNALEGKTVSGAFEKRYIHKKGHVVTCEVTSSLVYDAEGSPLYFISHVRDITKRKQAERELEEEREREKRYLDIAGVIILVTDTKGEVTLINRRGCEILGCAQEEIIGKRWIDNFIPPRIRDDVNVIEHMMMTGQIEAAEYHENYLMTKSGAERLISWHNTLLRDEQGGITGILSSGTDITERKQAEEQLKYERNKFSILSDNAPFGMLMIDKDGNFIYQNQKFKKLFGYDLSDVPDGRTWFKKAYPDREYRHMVISSWVDDLKQATGGEKRQEQYTVRCKDGTEKIINFIPVQLETGLQIMSFEDITERKHAEEEVKHGFEQLRETFISTVNALASTVEMKDQYTAGHQPRTTQLACAIAEEMGLAEAQIEGLRMAGSLHDIGKIVVPAEILNKPGPLTEIQYEMVKMHVQAGHDVLKVIQFPWPVAQIVLQHHELMNGSGYPQGLSGDEIVPEARILTVANVVEAMTAHRPYRSAYDITEALAEISKNRGILYDPAVVDACLRLFTEKRFTFN